MPANGSMTYAGAGVDIVAGYASVKLMKQHVLRTHGPEVLNGIGGFGGLFSIRDMPEKQPVLVSGTDGVGTKLKLAFLQDRHDTVGIDCVAMCVNDIVCCGARPLFFLDYIACGKVDPERVASIVKGVSEGCAQAGCALIGGETAEHPGMMPEDEYDIAGFAVGVVDQDKLIDGSTIADGDVLIGLASSGLHSNGFSLVRKLFSDDELTASPDMLTPTRIYVKEVAALCGSVTVKGLAHITGGGFIENIPRMLPDGAGLGVLIGGAWDIPAIFHAIRERGQIEKREMFNTYNMGVGMTAAVSPEEAEKAVEALGAIGQKAWMIGRVVKGRGIEFQ